MNGLSVGWSNERVRVDHVGGRRRRSRSSTWSPIRTADARVLAGAREDAVGQVVDVEAGAGGSRRPRLGGVMGRSSAWSVAGTSPRAIRSSRGSVTEQEPNEVNQRRARRADVAMRGERRRRRAARGRRSRRRPSRRPRAPAVATSTLRKPCAPPPSGSWRTARCRPAVPLKRGLAVERGVDPGGDRRGVGDEVVVDVAEAQLEPVARRRRPRRRRRARRRSAGSGQLDEDGVRRRRRPARRRRRCGGRCRPGRRGRAAAISTRRHVAGPSRAASAERDRRPGPAPPVTTTDSGAPKPRTSGRSVSRSTKLPTRSAYHSSRRAPYGARSRRGAGRRRAGRSPRRRRGRATARARGSRRDRQVREWSHGATLATR